MSRELLFFFSAIGAFNGLILGLYFLLKAKPKHQSNTFLGLLIIVLSVRIGKSVFYYFNPDLGLQYLQLGLSACLFIGPFLYFYTTSNYQRDKSFWKPWLFHTIIFLIIVVIGALFYPYHREIKLWKEYIIASIELQWMVYILATWLRNFKFIKRQFKKGYKKTDQEIFSLSVLIGTSIIWAAYFNFPYVSYIVGALSFSFMLYMLILFLFFSRKRSLIVKQNSEKYGDKKIPSGEADQLISQLKSLFEDESLHQNANLAVADVAQKLKVTPHLLSQLINDNLNTNFPSLVNEYRIDSAKRLILSSENLTLESIGYDSGFNSKSTFFSTFKKITGQTPAQFKETNN